MQLFAYCGHSMLKLLVLLSALLVLPAPARAQAAPAPAQVTLEALASAPGMTHARISPDGKHIAAIHFDGQAYTVMMGDAETLTFKPIVRTRRAEDGFYEYEKVPRFVIWIDNDLLAIDYNQGANSVTLDGKFVADLGEGLIGRITGDQPGSQMVLAITDMKSGAVARINARTGKKTRFSFPMPGKPVKVAFDKHGEPRAVTMADSGFWKSASSVANWYRPAKGDWIKLAEYRIGEEYWVPLYVPEEEHRLVISSRAGRDTRAIFTYDTQARKTVDMVAGHPTFDVTDVDGFDQEVFRRVWISGMQPTQVWFDPAWEKKQAVVDAALPQRINILSGDPAGRVLVFSYGDVDPGAWYVLDPAKQELRHFGTVHSTVDPATMRPMTSISYPSTDGLTIPAFLTLPASGSKALPVVVLLHGGPTMRDRWAFEADVQLLASRGYAVLQPQFRGSSGFGRKFQEAGYGQWGMAMQDDVSAGVAYLVKEGVADPRRVCIAGSSYGGYAALWGLVKTPELYQCAISFAGVTDLELMFKDASDRVSNKIVMELMRNRVGDVETNKQQFDAVSPLQHAARIKAPVLLMHGRLDRRVPIVHATRMQKALSEQGKQVEWLVFEDEGHSIRHERNQRTYFRKMVAFLDRHIGPGRQQPVPAPSAKP